MTYKVIYSCNLCGFELPEHNMPTPAGVHLRGFQPVTRKIVRLEDQQGPNSRHICSQCVDALVNMPEEDKPKLKPHSMNGDIPPDAKGVPPLS